MGKVEEGNGGGLPSGMSLNGIQTLRVSYKDADEIYIHPGTIHINDGADKYFTISSKVTKQLTSLSVSTYYAIYVDPSSISGDIDADDIEYTDTMPTLDDSKNGYYHPTNTTWRCIGFIYSDSSSNILSFQTTGKKYIIKGNFNDFVWAAVSSRQDVTCTIPLGSLIVIGWWQPDTGSTSSYISTGGEENADISVYPVGGRPTVYVEIITNSSKQISLYSEGTVSMHYFTRGFYLPDEIYTG